MPICLKASVICCGLFRLSRGPKPSSGSTPSGGGKCASSLSAALSRRSRTYPLGRQPPTGRGETAPDPLGRFTPPLAHGFFEPLPSGNVELDAGELHLRYRCDRPELYLRDATELLVFKRGGELLAQRQEDRGVSGGVLSPPRRQPSSPV